MFIYLKVILEYILVFLIIFLFGLIINKNGKKKKKEIPIEMMYLKYLYKIDISKINYKKFYYIYNLINAFIISTIYIIVIYLVKSMIMQIILGIVLLILMLIICYGLLARYYERKIEKCTIIKK